MIENEDGYMELLFKIAPFFIFGASAIVLAVVTGFIKYECTSYTERKVLYILTFGIFFLDLVMVLMLML